MVVFQWCKTMSWGIENSSCDRIRVFLLSNYGWLMVSKKNMFIHTWGRFPFSLIFFNGVETTNQMAILGMSLWFSTSQYSYTPKNVEQIALKIGDTLRFRTLFFVFSCLFTNMPYMHCHGCKWIWLPWRWQVGKTMLVSTLRIHFKRPFFPEVLRARHLR